MGERFGRNFAKVNSYTQARLACGGANKTKNERSALSFLKCSIICDHPNIFFSFVFAIFMESKNGKPQITELRKCSGLFWFLF